METGRVTEMESGKNFLELEKTKKKLWSLREQLEKIVQCKGRLGVDVRASLNELQTLMQWTADKGHLPAERASLLQKHIQHLHTLQKDLEKSAPETEALAQSEKSKPPCSKPQDLESVADLEMHENLNLNDKKLQQQCLEIHLKNIESYTCSKTFEASHGSTMEEESNLLIDFNDCKKDYAIKKSYERNTDSSHDSLGPNLSEDEGLGDESRRGDLSTGSTSLIEIPDTLVTLSPPLSSKIILIVPKSDEKTKDDLQTPNNSLDICLSAIGNLRESLRVELLNLSALQKDQKQIAVLQEGIVNFHNEFLSLKLLLDTTKKENESLKEQVLELEEAENDARLQAQKLGEKLTFLQEKDSHFQTEFCETKQALEKCIEELAVKQREEHEWRSQLKYMEALVQKYEDQIRTMEIVEIALRKKLIEQDDEFQLIEKSIMKTECEHNEQGTQTYDPQVNGKRIWHPYDGSFNQNGACERFSTLCKCVQVPDDSSLSSKLSDTSVQTDADVHSTPQDSGVISLNVEEKESEEWNLETSVLHLEEEELASRLVELQSELLELKERDAKHVASIKAKQAERRAQLQGKVQHLLGKEKEHLKQISDRTKTLESDQLKTSYVELQLELSKMRERMRKNEEEFRRCLHEFQSKHMLEEARLVSELEILGEKKVRCKELLEKLQSELLHQGEQEPPKQGSQGQRRSEKELQEDLRGQEEMYKARISELESEVSHLHEQGIRDLPRDLNGRSRDTQFREREAKLREKVEAMEEKEAAYRETLEQADRIVAAVEQGYNNRIQELERSEKSLKQRVEEVETADELQLAEAEARETRLQEQLQTLEKSHRKATTQVKELEKIRDKLELQLHDQDELSSSLKKSRQELELTRKSFAQSKKAEEALKGALQQTEKMVTVTESQMRILEEEKRSMEDTIGELRAQLRRMKQNLERIAEEERIPHQTGSSLRTTNFKRNKAQTQAVDEEKDYDEVLPRPANFHVVQQVGSDTLLVGWDYVNPSILEGYEVYLEGQLQERLYPADRTKALIGGLNLQRPSELGLCALSPFGQRSEPATLCFQPHFQGEDEGDEDSLCDEYGLETKRPYSMEW